MRVISNGTLLNRIKTLDIFQLDLGNAMLDQKSNEIDIKDTFIFKYFSLTGRQILNYGKIGKLGIYQDFKLSDDEYFIFNNEKLYTVIYDDSERKLNVEEHLTNIIMEIEENEGIDESDVIVEQKGKNPDIRLPKDQYIQEMIKKRKG